MLLATYGVESAEPSGQWPKDYADASAVYTPAWQERFTGIDRQIVIRFAREWAKTAARSEGKCSVIIGAGANHWHHPLRDYIVQQLRQTKLRFSMEDPNNPESYPRLWYIWRGNALQASAKGHEYFLRHYLGTHSNAIADEVAREEVTEVVWHEQVELGKIDIVVDLNFRMDTSALYSDIVLPAATYHEKDDFNTTDLHTFIHPLQAAITPCWESRSDWAIFRDIAQSTSQMAERYLPKHSPMLVSGV